MYCPNCGVETVDEAKFCKDSGGFGLWTFGGGIF